MRLLIKIALLFAAMAYFYFNIARLGTEYYKEKKKKDSANKNLEEWKKQHFKQMP